LSLGDIWVLKDILYATIDDPIWEMKYEIIGFSKNQLLYILSLKRNLELKKMRILT
jgi:hypothetical protein